MTLEELESLWNQAKENIEMSSEEVISRLKSQANRLPNKPGVYIMSNDKDKVIYVYKAKGLKIERRSYFTQNLLMKKWKLF